MNEAPTLREELLHAYRQRQAPPGFARRVAARVPTELAPRGYAWRWIAVGALGMVLAAAILVPLSLERPRHETEPATASYTDLPLFPARADSPTEVRVPGLSNISELPLFPARPSIDDGALPEVRRPEMQGRLKPAIKFARTSKELLNVRS